MSLTAGYDILAQIHEKALNKSMALLYYSGKIGIKGNYSLADKVPVDFKPFSNFDYEISLTKEPFVDFRGRNQLYLLFGGRIKITLFGCVDVYFSVDFSIDAKIIFTLATRKLQFKLNKVKVLKITAMDRAGVSNQFLSKLNYIVDEILNAYFSKESVIDLPTVPLQDLQLPVVGSNLSAIKADVLIYDARSLMVGISFFEKKGNLSQVQNRLGNTDCYVAVSESAAGGILDYCWNKIEDNLKADFDETVNINFASAATGKASDVLARVITLGFIQTETEYDNMTMRCSGDIAVNSVPALNFTADGNVEVLNLDIDANVNVKIDALRTQSVTLDKSSIIPDSLTKFEDDVLLSKKENEPATLVNTKNNFKIKVEKASAKLVFDSVKNDGTVKAKVTDVDFKVEFDRKGSTFSDTTWTKLMSYVKQYIVDKIPEFSVSPSIILSDLKIFDNYTLSLKNSNLIVSEDGVAIETDINVNEIRNEETDIPNYVVDMATKKVHDFSCDDVSKIGRGNRKGFYVMYEALFKGYLPCSKCLNGYSLVGK
ncbi:MAG: hypothetical protein IJ905_08805 [Fibrobacter sp.]|nr:hypothetical protein [Fibrobacter sp.]